MFGSDFWKILKLIIAIFKLFAQELGNDEDRQSVKDNGFE